MEMCDSVKATNLNQLYTRSARKSDNHSELCQTLNDGYKKPVVEVQLGKGDLAKQKCIKVFDIWKKIILNT